MDDRLTDEGPNIPSALFLYCGFAEYQCISIVALIICVNILIKPNALDHFIVRIICGFAKVDLILYALYGVHLQFLLLSICLSASNDTILFNTHLNGLTVCFC